jgi:hypothetical protein
VRELPQADEEVFAAAVADTDKRLRAEWLLRPSGSSRSNAAYGSLDVAADRLPQISAWMAFISSRSPC